MSGYTPISTRESEVVLVRTSMLSQFTDFANVLKAFIGTSYISLPFAFYQSGLALGAVGLILIALITSHCCELIIKCKNAAVKLVLESLPQYRELQEEGCTEEMKQIKENIEREMSLGDISLIALGPWGIRIVNVALVLTQTGFCVAYFIFMGNTLTSMFPVKFTAPSETPNVTASVSTLFATLNDSTTVILGAHRLHQTKTPAIPCSSCTAHGTLTNSSTYSKALSGVTTAPNFVLLELIPLPFLVLMAFIRNLRKLGPISAIANVALLTAFFGVLGYMLNGFHFKINDIRLASFATFPVFFGQLTCAYEGIGCIIPIESSMADNRPRFPLYLQLAISQVSVILGSFGILGYLIYGSNVPQIVTDTLPSGPLAQGIRVTLCIAVLFTYPLQLFPVIEIFEGLIFSKSLQREKSHLSVVAAGNSESTHLSNDSYLKYQSVPNTRDVESPTAPPIQSSQSGSYGASQSINNDVKIDTPYQTPTWKRNLLRSFLVCVTAAIAWALRDDFAYVNAFIGSVGSSMLAYILPCTFHLVLLKHENSRFTVVKNICFIVFGIVGGIVGVAITIDSMVKSFTKH